MRVLVAGATGAVGRELIPELLDRGHTVIGLSRDPGQAEALGAVPVAVDAMDADAVMRALTRARPDAVVHQLTSLPVATGLWRFDHAFARTNQLRTVGTDNLLAAARATGARRLVAQSFAGWPYARTGGPVKVEDDPLDSDPPKQLRPTLDAIRYLEDAVVGARDLRGVALRYGSFYGPGTHLDRGSTLAEQVRRRMMPIVGDGGGVWSFVHIGDVARATALAVESDEPGVFNVVDDEPAEVSEWLPALATAMGARPPRSMPSWVAAALLPEHLRVMMTEVRGASNARFKSAFGWRPRTPSWREGFAELFG